MLFIILLRSVRVWISLSCISLTARKENQCFLFRVCQGMSQLKTRGYVRYVTALKTRLCQVCHGVFSKKIARLRRAKVYRCYNNDEVTNSEFWFYVLRCVETVLRVTELPGFPEFGEI